MLWKYLKDKSAGDFQRYTGVKLPTFQLMIEAVLAWEVVNRNHRSRPYLFSIEDRILIMLCYYREYITYFHIAQKYRVSEATVCRTVRLLEMILIKSGMFNLPKKSNIPTDTTIEIVVVDASESSIERPQLSKYQKHYYSGKKNDIP